MKQGVFNNNHHRVDTTNIKHNNANAFVAKAGLKKTSFANELNNLQNANQFINNNESGDPLAQENLSQQKIGTPDQEMAKFKDVLSKALANKGLDFDTLTPELKEKLALMQDAVKQEVIKRQSNEEANQNAEELQNKFSSNEKSIANASQENQKQITEAIREGSAGQHEQSKDQSEQRKEQLANWDELAPRVIEDPKNRAVRIDIPGLPEIETVIVRMQGSKVAIQTVGDAKTMERLQNREKELVSRLSAHNISVEQLKTFDSNALKKGRV